MPKSPVLRVKTITGNDVVDKRGSGAAGHRDSEGSSVGQLNEKFRRVANLNCGSPACEWVTFRQTEGKLQVGVPQGAPDPNVNVIVVKTY
jgi:hypothetical protein